MSELLDVGQWAKNWEAMARQAQAAMSGNPGMPAWSSAPMPGSAWMENMTKVSPFAGGKQQSEAIEHLLAGAQGYLGMLQSLANGVMGQGAGSSPLADALAGSGFAGAFPASAMGNPFAAAIRGFGSQGARGFEQMMEQFATAAGPMFDKAKGALQMPAFGPLREKQENLQKTAQVFIDYQEQSARHDRLMLKVAEQSFARFQLKLAEREEPGRQIDSARGLYDLWWMPPKRPTPKLPCPRSSAKSMPPWSMRRCACASRCRAKSSASAINSACRRAARSTASANACRPCAASSAASVKTPVAAKPCRRK